MGVLGKYAGGKASEESPLGGPDWFRANLGDEQPPDDSPRSPCSRSSPPTMRELIAVRLGSSMGGAGQPPSVQLPWGVRGRSSSVNNGDVETPPGLTARSCGYVHPRRVEDVREPKVSLM